MDPTDTLTALITQAKTKIPKGHERALAEAIANGLRKQGKAIVDEDEIIGNTDDHLKTLKNIRRRIMLRVEDDECSTRDLAALARRLQDVSKEITALEAKIRQERPANGNSSANKTTSTTGAWDSSKV